MTIPATLAAAGPSTGPAGSASPVTRLPILLITGLSGAGNSTALKGLEDIGYEAVDNLPLRLLGGLTGVDSGLDRPIAICVDSRTRGFSATALIERFDRLRAEPQLAVRLLFLQCSDDVLSRRFSETRRRHPLALDRPVADGIRQERRSLAPLLDRADLVIDTSDLAIADLRRLLHGHFTLPRAAGAAISVTSFAYRYGLPREADLVFDVRFLRNPHYIGELRALTGSDEPVGRFVADDPAFQPFFASLTALILPLLPRFEREGKSYLTLAIGCTGGRHRSVYVAERLAGWLRQQGRTVNLRHRDLAGNATDET